jgi:hypothetical protein
MKFSEHLTAHVTPEWHKQYVTYEVIEDIYEDHLSRRSLKQRVIGITSRLSIVIAGWYAIARQGCSRWL